MERRQGPEHLAGRAGRERNALAGRQATGAVGPGSQPLASSVIRGGLHSCRGPAQQSSPPHLLFLQAQWDTSGARRVLAQRQGEQALTRFPL